MKRVPGFLGPRLFHPQGPASSSRAEPSGVQPRESQGDSGAAVVMGVLVYIHTGHFPAVSPDTRRVTIDRGGPGPL